MEHQAAPRRPCLDLAADGAPLEAEHYSPRGSRLAMVVVQTPDINFAHDVGLAQPVPRPHHSGIACRPWTIPRSTPEE